MIKLSEYTREALVNDICGYIRKNNGECFVNDIEFFDGISTLLADRCDIIIGIDLKEDLRSCAVRISPLALWNAVCNGEFHGEYGCRLSSDVAHGHYIFRDGHDWSGLSVWSSAESFSREVAYAVESLILRTQDSEAFNELLSDMYRTIQSLCLRMGLALENDID